MFFTNMQEWSNKKLRIAYILSLVSYFLLMLVGPFTVVAIRYKLFENDGTRTLSGFAIVLVLILAVVGLKILKTKIRNFPENTLNQRRIKFSFELVYSLALPIVIIVALVALKTNFELAFSTVRDTMIFLVLGILEDNLIVKYIESEKHIRDATQFDVEKAKRTKLFK